MKSHISMLRLSGYLVGTAAAATLVSCGAAKAPESRPNVIYIMADDLGYADITPYGQQLIETPNIERLAAQGMLLTQCYAGCTVSAPSRASLMTGLHTGHTYVRGNYEIDPEGQCPMPAGTYTLGTLFSNAGYVTGAFGKWGLGYPGSESVPSKVGFDRFYGYNCQRMAHTYYPDHLWDDDRRVDFPENADPGRQTYSQDIIHAEALDFIHENAEAGRPFFAYLAYTLPHAELCLPHDEVYQHYVEKFKDAPADAKPWMTNGDYGTSEHPMASFAAMVSRLDRYVGEVMALMEKEGIADNTLIVFTSDNGPHREGGANPDFFHSYGPLRGCKRDMYEGGIRVPFIVSYPGHIAEGTKSDQIMAFWDIMPTFAELIGSSDEITTDGISMLPAWTGGKQEQHPYLYWEFHELGGRQAVRMGDWKGIRLNVGNDRTSFELYNLADDIHEERNVAAENPDITARINEIMDTARTPSELFNFGRAVQK